MNEDKKTCKNCIHAYTGHNYTDQDGKEEPEILCAALKGAINLKNEFDAAYSFVKMHFSPEDLAEWCDLYVTLTEAHMELSKFYEKGKKK